MLLGGLRVRVVSTVHHLRSTPLLEPWGHEMMKKKMEKEKAGWLLDIKSMVYWSNLAPFMPVSHPEGDMWTIRTWFPRMKLNDYPIVVYWCFSLMSVSCFSLVLRSFPAFSQFDISPTLAWLKQNFASGKGKGKMSVKVVPRGVVYASSCWDFSWQATLICIWLHFHDPFWCGSIWGQKSSFSNIYETQTTIIRSSPDFKWHHLQIVSVYHVCKFEDWCWVSSSTYFNPEMMGV